VEINIMARTTMEVITWDSGSIEVTRTELHPNQNGGIKKEVLTVQKRPRMKERLATQTHLLLGLVMVKCI
jgi:hypothetical protein